jgi:hypothetical protein
MFLHFLFRSHELGVWGLPENVAFLQKEHRAVWGLNPTANLSECLNARFWTRAGGKGPYMGRGEVVLQEASSSILQIVRTKHFETTGRRGGGPTQEELMQRGEERRKSVEGLREKARRMTAESVGDLARGAVIGTGGSPGGVTTVVRRADRVAESSRSREREDSREPVVESTHRHDKVLVEMQKEGRGLKRPREQEEVKKGEMDYFEVAVKVAEGFCSLEDLDSEDRKRVLKMQKMAEAGNKKSVETGGERRKERVEDMEVEAGEYIGSGRAFEGGLEKEEDFREMVRRLAQERLAARGGGQGLGGSVGGTGESSGQRREVQGERSEEVGVVPLPGEERYEESGWTIARLKRGDESGCVGVKAGGGGRCGVITFERTRDKDASGVLVLFK